MNSDSDPSFEPDPLPQEPDAGESAPEFPAPEDNASELAEEDSAHRQEMMEEAFLNLQLPSEALEKMPTIPAHLHSTYEEGLFSSCAVCENLLRNEDRIYKLEKVMRNGECIFEMALCGACTLDQQRQLSEDSREAIQEFLSAHYQPSTSMDHCHLCRSEIESDADRSLTATCARDRLLQPPVVICSNCAEKTQELLSRETRDSFSDFIETHFPGVPAEWEPSPTLVS